MIGKRVLKYPWAGRRPQASHIPYFERHFVPLQFGRSGHSLNANRFSPEEDAIIVQMRKEGRRNMEIAGALGRPSCSVSSRYCHHLIYKYPGAPPPARLPKDGDRMRGHEVLSAFQRGVSFAQIGREMGISPQRVGRLFDLVSGPSDRSGRSSRIFTDAEDQIIKTRAVAGFSVSQIALELKRHRTSVTCRMRQIGSDRTKRVIPRKERVSAAEVERLRAMQQSGHSVNDIVAAVCRHPSTVRRHLDPLSNLGSAANTLHESTKRRAWTPAERSEMVRLFDHGLSRRELAAHFGRSYENAASFLRDELRRLGRTEGLAVIVPWTTEEDILLRSYRDRNLSWREIAALMPGRTIWSIKHRYTRIQDAKAS